MGERSGRTTRRFESADLIALTKKPIVNQEEPVRRPDDDDPFADWDERTGSIATGSQPMPTLPISSRTQTLCDPMATALLAEVARRTQTVELDPTMVSAALRTTQEIDADVLAEVLRDEPKRSAK